MLLGKKSLTERLIRKIMQATWFRGHFVIQIEEPISRTLLTGLLLDFLLMLIILLKDRCYALGLS